MTNIRVIALGLALAFGTALGIVSYDCADAAGPSPGIEQGRSEHKANQGTELTKPQPTKPGGIVKKPIHGGIIKKPIHGGTIKTSPISGGIISKKPTGTTTGTQKTTEGCPGTACPTGQCRTDCINQNPDTTTVDSAGNVTVNDNSPARASCVTNTCHP